MKLDLSFERVYPRPPEAVWRALTDRELLGEWLMCSDFEPRPGRRFRLWDPADSDTACRFDCELLVYEPPRHMVWAWQEAGRQGGQPMQVRFTLEPVPEGTRLRVRHSGERTPETVESFRSGWPGKLDALEHALPSG